ncbi:MAG: hypothetical protein JSR98_10425, partial [Proteobacteria bacterium]|nr:hypothetical protein [Pseudomonadota bacterium]
MVAVSSSTVAALPPVSTGVVGAASPAGPQPTPSAYPVDTVTLSDTAQQIFDDAAAPPPAAPGAPIPSRDQVAAAVAALNDTSGQTGLSDQVAAYDLVGTLVAKGQVVTAKTLLNVNPSPAATNVGTITTDQAQALVASAFAQRVEQVVGQVDAARAAAADPTKAVQAGLAAFNRLSADDQQ